jgi:glycerol-3-phosphate acyltransferase PlsX
MMKAIRLLREDETVSGIVSTGSTGALVAAATLRVGRLAGVIRPAFCPIMPTMNGGVVGVCDSGANVDITPDYLQQYAVMGSLYMKKVYGMQDVRVALLNVGTEKEKGDDLRKKAYELLSATPDIHFVGNMESRDLLSGNYDLVVCDGFAGNVLLKSIEGTAMFMGSLISKMFKKNLLSKLSAALVMKDIKAFKKLLDYREIGGTPFLGIRKPVIKAHGSSDALAFRNAIHQAMNTPDISKELEEGLAKLSNKENTDD